MLSHIKHTYIKVFFFDYGLIISYYIAIVLFAFRSFISKNIKRIAYFSIGIILVFVILKTHIDYNRLNISIIDVGQGDSALVRYKGFSMLIDTGPVVDDYSALKRVVLPYILKNNVPSLDVLVLTHKHDDHIGDFEYLLKEMNVSLIVTSYDVYNENIIKLKGRNLLIVDNQTGYLYKDLKINFLPPVEGDENSSVVTKISCGKFSMLFMADASIKSEDLYIKNYALDANILKVGHHGSNTATSDRFLDCVMPKFAVISVGKNNIFSHPSDEVLERLRKRNIKIFRTDLNGTIEIVKEKNILYIKPYIK